MLDPVMDPDGVPLLYVGRLFLLAQAEHIVAVVDFFSEFRILDDGKCFANRSLFFLYAPASG